MSSPMLLNSQLLLHFRIRTPRSYFYALEPALASIQFSCSLYCIIGPVVSNVFMRGTLIPTIRVTTLMLGMGDTPITRALANNKAVAWNSVQIKVIVTYCSYNVRLVTRLWNVRGTKQKQILGSVKGIFSKMSTLILGTFHVQSVSISPTLLTRTQLRTGTNGMLV
jgi:hypothetical protein